MTLVPDRLSSTDPPPWYLPASHPSYEMDLLTGLKYKSWVDQEANLTVSMKVDLTPNSHSLTQTYPRGVTDGRF